MGQQRFPLSRKDEETHYPAVRIPRKITCGESRQDDIWLVIQHAPLEKQEQYFPLIDAAAKRELRKSSWALLVDRIRMYKASHRFMVLKSCVTMLQAAGNSTK